MIRHDLGNQYVFNKDNYKVNQFIKKPHKVLVNLSPPRIALFAYIDCVIAVCFNNKQNKTKILIDCRLKLLSRVGSYISVETHAFHASIILIEIAQKQHIFSFVFEINNKLKDFQWIRRKCDNVTVQY